jgi:hypothetical protein
MAKVRDGKNIKKTKKIGQNKQWQNYKKNSKVMAKVRDGKNIKKTKSYGQSKGRQKEEPRCQQQVPTR